MLLACPPGDITLAQLVCRLSDVVVKILFGWIFNIVYQASSYSQVILLTPVNNSQFLLKLEFLDKFRLVTFHKNTTQRNYNILTD